MELRPETAPVARIRARSRARTPHTLPIRPSPERSLRVEVSIAGRVLVVLVDLFGGASMADPSTSYVLGSQDGREVVVSLLDGEEPIRARLLDRVAGAPAGSPSGDF